MSDETPNKKWLLFEDSLLVLFMAALACITMCNVLARYFTTSSFAWTEELSIFLLILVTMVGSSSAFIRYQHIRIELIINSCSSRLRQRLDWVASTVCLAFFILFTVLFIRLCLDEIEYGGISPAIGVPMWYYTIFLPLFSLLISLRLLRQWWELSTAILRGKK